MPTPAGAPAPATAPAGAPAPATAPAGAPAPTSAPAGAPPPEVPPDPGFLERGGLRRRMRFLRKTRELAYRDLGGLMFELHRMGGQREDLLRGKLVTLERIDTELRAIEDALHERRGVTVLREAGVTACPRCAAIHGSEDRFCPACGFSMGRSERPIAGSPVATPAGAPAGTPVPVSATTPPAAAARPNPSPPSPSAVTPPPVSPAAAPVSAQRAPLSARTGNSMPPTSAGRSPVPPPAPAPAPTPTPSSAQVPPPPSDADQPTEIVEPPTQIVRPGESSPGKSSRA